MEPQTKDPEILTPLLVRLLQRWKESERLSPAFFDVLHALESQVLQRKGSWLARESVFPLVLDCVYNSDGVGKAFREIKAPADGASLDQTMLNALAAEISGAIEEIPIQYDVYFSMPRFPHPGTAGLKLSETVWLIETEDQALQPNEPTNSLLSFASAASLAAHIVNKDIDRGLQKPMVYLRITTQGFASDSLDDSALATAWSKFRQIIYLASALNIVAKAEKKRVLGIAPKTPDASISWGRSAKDAKISGRVPLPHGAVEYFGELTPVRDSQDTGQHGSLSGEDGHKDVISGVLLLVAKAAENPEDDPDTKPIRTAAEWAFDAATNANQTIAFLQTCIGLESILGYDSDRQNTTEMLADRCSYLLGESFNDRKLIREKFSNIYRTRSKLVHGRRSKLSAQDAKHLFDATRLLRLAVRKEFLNYASNLSKKSEK